MESLRYTKYNLVSLFIVVVMEALNNARYDCLQTTEIENILVCVPRSIIDT